MATPSAEMQSVNGARRRRFLTIFSLAVLALAALVLSYYLIFLRGYVSTDNAYVNGNLVQATAQTAGTVIAVDADDTQLVQAGGVLVSLDPVDARVTLARAESALARVVREVRGTFASNTGLIASVKAREAEVARARADLTQAQQDVQRRVDVQSDGGVSAEELAHARSALISAQAALDATLAAATEASQNLAANEARIEGSVVATNPTVMQAAADLKEAYIAMERTTVQAPATGVIARRSAQLGARVQPGQVLATIVPLDEIWVDANFKESQLRDMRIGQPVRLESDLYGGKVEYRGTVVGLGAGTGSAFSVLPAQNATGNWIKIVQRVPVRIALDPEQLAKQPLRIGLSMSVSVDTRPSTGPAVAGVAAPGPKYRTRVFEGIEAAADAHVQEVIAANLPGRQTAARRSTADRRVARSR